MYKPEKQESCYLIYTTKQTHEIINKNLKKSAMYGGYAEGIGPRYCPSIEDKIVRFNDKERHQLFLEPETKKYDILVLRKNLVKKEGQQTIFTISTKAHDFS